MASEMPMWNAILKWSLTQTDGTTSSESKAKPMDPERRKWLQDAMNSFVLDETKRMEALVRVLEYNLLSNPSLTTASSATTTTTAMTTVESSSPSSSSSTTTTSNATRSIALLGHEGETVVGASTGPQISHSIYHYL